jgi:molybdenum cofactor biosynthesis enzyme MoaA
MSGCNRISCENCPCESPCYKKKPKTTLHQEEVERLGFIAELITGLEELSRTEQDPLIHRDLEIIIKLGRRVITNKSGQVPDEKYAEYLNRLFNKKIPAFKDK